MAENCSHTLAHLRSQDIIGTNLLTKFHEDRNINVATRVLTRFYYSLLKKNAPPPGSRVFQPTSIIFELFQDIIGMNLLTKFHEDQTVNVASRVLTRKNSPLGGHVFKATKTIFELIQVIIGTNLLIKFHDDRKINVASRGLTRFYYSHRKKIAPPRCGHVFQPTGIIFKLVLDIIGMDLLTEFHEDLIINVASGVLTRKNAPPPGSHVFQPTGIIFKLFQDIIGMNLLSKKNARPLGGHVFQANVTIFELIQDIIKTNLLTIFHQDWTINVASRVKNAPPSGIGANRQTDRPTNQQTGQKQYVPHYYRCGGHL
ncbi:hypothetical protein DPMN_056114 [Dreissena polymorpha]|uniref:Uncharacterized protein n=1 Tax=Dreissena polymorpha TaxID=45954 RepID=A0A9D4CTQ9_DREPO|nr:hypothetical protein DPMN_056114 [Dreissena polymorpha]